MKMWVVTTKVNGRLASLAPASSKQNAMAATKRLAEIDPNARVIGNRVLWTEDGNRIEAIITHETI